MDRKNGLTIRGRIAAPICIALLGVLNGPVAKTRAQTIDLNGTTTATVAAGAYTSIIVGDTTASGTSTANQGSVAVTDSGTFTIGNASGATGIYNLSGSGTLGLSTSTTAYIGYNGTGTFNQSGTSAVTGGTMVLAYNPGSVGTYNMSGGTLTLTTGLLLSDDASTATFTQTGGTVTAPTLQLDGFSTSSSGTYTLGNGTVGSGTLIAGAVINGKAGATSTFNFNGGTLQASAGSTAFMTGLTSAKVQAGGAIINNGGFAITIGQALIHDSALGATVDGGLSVSGTGTLTLTAANTYTGGTIINAGILNLGVSNALNTSKGTIFFGGGTLQYGASVTTDYSGRLSGSAAQSFKIDTNGNNVTFATAIGGTTSTFTKLGTGTLALNSSGNSFTGTTTISAGTLALGTGNTLGALSPSSAIVDNATLTINRSNAVTQGTDFSTAAITGTGGFTQAGTGTTTLSAANTYSGVTTISAGKLTLTNALAVQNSTVTNSVTNGVVFDSSVSGNAFTFGGLAGSTNLVLANNAATPAAVALTVGNNSTAATYSGVLSGAGSLVKTGTGTQTLTGANTYTGTTTISAGALALGSNGALGSTSSITLSGSGAGYFSIVGLTGPVVNPTATLTLNGTSYFQAQGDALTVASLSGVSGSQLTIGDYVITGTGGGTYAGPFTVGNGTSTTYAGLITGTAASGTLLTKVGSGTLTLSGANIYTGPTAINGGILQVARAETAGT